jgi:predicted transcriptional regulator
MDAVELGPLEAGVMDVVWRHGAGDVRQVAAQLSRPLAYTTVMTTLDRLYKKGLLERRKRQRAFVYAAKLDRTEWLRHRASHLISAFFAAPHPGPRLARGAMLSCLLEAVESYDAALLDELEARIQAKRRSLEPEARAKADTRRRRG